MKSPSDTIMASFQTPDPSSGFLHRVPRLNPHDVMGSAVPPVLGGVQGKAPVGGKFIPRMNVMLYRSAAQGAGGNP
jgi:hypothetical protein